MFIDKFPEKFKSNDMLKITWLPPGARETTLKNMGTYHEPTETS